MTNHIVCICQICDTPMPQTKTLPQGFYAACETCITKARKAQK